MPRVTLHFTFTVDKMSNDATTDGLGPPGENTSIPWKATGDGVRTRGPYSVTWESAARKDLRICSKDLQSLRRRVDDVSLRIPLITISVCLLKMLLYVAQIGFSSTQNHTSALSQIHRS